MPDAALEATERQFLRLVGGCNRIAQIYVHPFGVSSQDRGERARSHMAAHYRNFEDLEKEGLDALVITGANPANPDLTRESFWPGMVEVMDWGRTNVCSMVCSCLATHAVLEHYHGIERIALPRKRWGVYSHRLVNRSHPLLAHIDTRFDAPHSHVYEVTAEQVRASGGHVLVESAEAGVHLAVSADGFRFVYFQGHPEYDFNSLLKEHKREVIALCRGRAGGVSAPARALLRRGSPRPHRPLRRVVTRRTRRRQRGAGAAGGRPHPRSSTTLGAIPGRRCSTTGSASSTSSPTSIGASPSWMASTPRTRSAGASEPGRKARRRVSRKCERVGCASRRCREAMEEMATRAPERQGERRVPACSLHRTRGGAE